jgi:hypothetical protein
MHHDELGLGRDSGRIGVGEEPWRGVVDQGVAREYSRTGGGAPPSRADGEKRHDQRHDDWNEMSDSGDSQKSTPPAHRTGLFRPTTALPTPPVGVPALPWTWAKARS